jgi:hypothetical protein
MTEIVMKFQAICRGDRPGQLESPGDLDCVKIVFESPKELARWVKKHLGDDGPGGVIDVGRILREATEAVERFRREDECQGEAD